MGRRRFVSGDWTAAAAAAAAAAAVVVVLGCARGARAHGLMTEPPQRGILGGNQFAPRLQPVSGAPVDFFAHFPAGDKSTRPGAGKASQERAAGRNWTPYTPLDAAFVWRAGVCGDAAGAAQDHLKGGTLYFGGRVTRSYRQGAVLRMTNAITAHHNGFVEAHLCDVSKCPGGDVSTRCFAHTSACVALRRAADAECDGGRSPACGPVQRTHPGRWYLPCASGARFDEFSMTWQLPEHVFCDHCVLQWYWVSANTCNPPGVRDYFTGPDAPRAWGSCRGQGGAVGGFAANQRDCGADRFPEEYYQCADIRIERAGAAPAAPAAPSADDHQAVAAQSDDADAVAAQSAPDRDDDDDHVAAPPESRFLHIAVIADGRVVSEVLSGDDKAVDISAYRRVALEAVTSRRVRRVTFAINGRRVWTERSRPYFLFGNHGREPNYWPDPLINEEFQLSASAGADIIDVRITLIRADGR